jgi:hypothetical protein
MWLSNKEGRAHAIIVVQVAYRPKAAGCQIARKGSPAEPFVGGESFGAKANA